LYQRSRSVPPQDATEQLGSRADRNNQVLGKRLSTGVSNTLAEYKARLELAIARGWLWKHASGTYVKLTQAKEPRTGFPSQEP
jgi:hypothetical protein